MKVILSVPDEGYFERTWWRLFWEYLMILSVPDEYFERTWWRLFWASPDEGYFGFAYLMKVILSVPDEGYFERTWWRLFWASPDEGYWVFWLWAYLMKVIPVLALSVTTSFWLWASPDEGYSNILALSVPKYEAYERTWWIFYFNFWASPDEGYYYFLYIRRILFGLTYLMKVTLSVPDEGYFEMFDLMKVILKQRTWWRLCL